MAFFRADFYGFLILLLVLFFSFEHSIGLKISSFFVQFRLIGLLLLGQEKGFSGSFFFLRNSPLFKGFPPGVPLQADVFLSLPNGFNLRGFFLTCPSFFLLFLCRGCLPAVPCLFFLS